MSCPRCQHEHFVKNGFVNEKQRYKCKACSYQWTEKTHRGRPLAEKSLAVFLYGFHGLSMKVLHRKNPSRLTEHYSRMDTTLWQPTRTTRRTSGNRRCRA